MLRDITFISILNFDLLKIEACFIPIKFSLNMEEKLVKQVRYHKVLYNIINWTAGSYREEIRWELQMQD